jgi:tRNA(Ile)-lysidine synthase
MLKNAFEQHIKEKLSFLLESRLVVAVSGGIDSVVLVHLLQEIGCTLALAHCNFNLRAGESDTDEQFVKDLAQNLNLEVFVKAFDTEAYANKKSISIQMAARDLRYEWFDDLISNNDFGYVLTGHHADDNLETFLINLSRGTGLEGLKGIPEINGQIVRPLLPFSREEIDRFAQNQNIKWREDSSNSQSKYLRNGLRHEVLPKLKELSPQFLQNFNKTVSHLKDSSQLVNDRIMDVSQHFNLNRISIEKIKTLSNPKAYLYELFKDYGFTQWDDVAHLLDAQSGKQVFSNSHILLKDREFLILKPLVITDATTYEIQQQDTSVSAPFNMKINEVSAIDEVVVSCLYVDKEKLKFPLTVRKWEKGDYFYPLGMQGKKKLSKFFKDEKYSLFEKEAQWLLCSENKVVWVIGKRPDTRFKVEEASKHILKFQLD